VTAESRDIRAEAVKCPDKCPDKDSVHGPEWPLGEQIYCHVIEASYDLSESIYQSPRLA
jgi:hypothetical protein